MLFFVTAGLMLAFLHNWFFLLADGNASLTTYVWNAWTVIDVVLPIIFGVTGCRLMREGRRNHASASLAATSLM